MAKLFSAFSMQPGMRAVLQRMRQDGTTQIVRVVTLKADGLVDGQSLLDPEGLDPGLWRVSFATQDYFRDCSVAMSGAILTSNLTIDFEISAALGLHGKPGCRILQDGSLPHDLETIVWD